MTVECKKWQNNKSSFNFSTFVILSFFTLHCHNILSFVINYNSSSSIIVLLGKLDNIEHILCVSKRGKVFRQLDKGASHMDAKIMCLVGASHHKRSVLVLAASTCVKITCCFTKQPEANTIVGGGRGREGGPTEINLCSICQQLVLGRASLNQQNKLECHRFTICETSRLVFYEGGVQRFER